MSNEVTLIVLILAFTCLVIIVIYFTLLILEDNRIVKQATLINVDELESISTMPDGETIVSVLRQSGNRHCEDILFLDTSSAIRHAISVSKRAGMGNAFLTWSNDDGFQLRRDDFEEGSGYKSKRIGWVEVRRVSYE